MANYFKDNLKYVREQKGLSKNKLGELTGVNQTTIGRWETGEITPTIDNVIDLMQALNIPISELGEFLGKDLKFDNGEILELPKRIIKIPVYGSIKAGTPIEAQQDVLEYIDIPEEWIKSGKRFYGLKISGDSMMPKYQDNDIVIFEHNNDLTEVNGKDCAVMVNGFDATFKNVRLNQSGLQLIPLNINNSDGYEPTFYNSEQIQLLPVKIVGIAREKRTRL